MVSGSDTYTIKDENGKIIEEFKQLDWYDKIEEPFKDLVKLLRNNGFNTFCSCGHRPNPYIQMEWYDDIEVSKLYTLLVENNFYNFQICATWSFDTLEHDIFGDPILNYHTNQRLLEIKFYTNKKEGLANIEEIKKEEKKNGKN